MFEIWFIENGAKKVKKGSYKKLSTARTKKDKFDIIYGSYAHRIIEILQDGSERVRL